MPSAVRPAQSKGVHVCLVTLFQMSLSPLSYSHPVFVTASGFGVLFVLSLGHSLRLESWTETEFWDLNTATPKILRMREGSEWFLLGFDKRCDASASSQQAAKISTRQHFWLGLPGLWCWTGSDGSPGPPNTAFTAPNITKKYRHAAFRRSPKML